MKTQNVYGVISNGSHVDISRTERGAKNYATRNGFTEVTIRYNGGYVAQITASKKNNKWTPVGESKFYREKLNP